jgi:hypothetical protein
MDTGSVLAENDSVEEDFTGCGSEGGGVEPDLLATEDNEPLCSSKNQQRLPSGGVGKRLASNSRRVLKTPSPSEVCHGDSGLVVVRLASYLGEVEMVCASIEATAAIVSKRNYHMVADVIRKCAYDTEVVWVGGWYRKDGRPFLITSPQRGQVKRLKWVTPAAVLCQQ